MSIATERTRTWSSAYGAELQVLALMSMANTLEEHTLQLLRARYMDTLPWLCTQTGSKVTIVPSGRGNAFTLVAAWATGRHEKYYGTEMVRQLGRRGCARRLAELFVQEVRKARGEEIDDE